MPPAAKKNTFWKNRTKHGRDTLFANPKLLWEACCEYFQFCDDNPLIEVKAFAFQGEITHTEIPKMRVYTLKGLCLYLKCNEAYFRQFKDTKDRGFSTVIQEIEDTIYDQKFSGAASDLFNANIISRDLGLKDSSSVSLSGDVNIPIAKWDGDTPE